MLAAVLVGAFKQFAVIRANNERVLTHAVARQAQQAGDMIHNALRGDPIAAMLATRTHNAAPLAEIHNHHVDHAAVFRSEMATNAKLNLGDAIELTAKDAAAGETGFGSVQESFHEMKT